MGDQPFETDRNGASRDPATVSCLVRTRSAVFNVLLAIGFGISASGLLLGRHEAGKPPMADWPVTTRGAMVGLLGLIAAAYLILRVGSGREALRDPARRAARFFRARVATAVVAALAIPLGFVAGWINDPRPEVLVPYWVAALGLGFLAVPRGYELDDFDEAMAPPATGTSPGPGPRP